MSSKEKELVSSVVSSAGQHHLVAQGRPRLERSNSLWGHLAPARGLLAADERFQCPAPPPQPGTSAPTPGSAPRGEPGCGLPEALVSPALALQAIAASVAQRGLGELHQAVPRPVEELGRAAQQPLGLGEGLGQLLLPLRELGVALQGDRKTGWDRSTHPAHSLWR